VSIGEPVDGERRRDVAEPRGEENPTRAQVPDRGEETSERDERDKAVDLRGMEKVHIEKVLASCNWMIAGAQGAAERLGLPPSTLRSKMKKLGVARPGTS
jgi:transcriptional regulator with GAF, ATPase, and Fis domain